MNHESDTLFLGVLVLEPICVFLLLDFFDGLELFGVSEILDVLEDLDIFELFMLSLCVLYFNVKGMNLV